MKRTFNRTIRLIRLSVVMAALALAISCAGVTPITPQAKAQAEAKAAAKASPKPAANPQPAPKPTQVEVLSIPYNPAQPRYVVAVFPLDYGASDLTSGGYESGGPRHKSRVGDGMAAQLTTALTHAGNISVIENEMLQRQPDGTYTCKLQPGEVGPFIVKGMVTEFNETAESHEDHHGVGLGLPGAVLGIAGAIADEPGLGWTGAGIAVANPTMHDTSTERKGMVGLDLKLVDARSGRIVRGYACSGTFATVSSTNGFSVFGMGGGSSTFASTALGQATRAAMNDALRQTAEALATAAR